MNLFFNRATNIANTVTKKTEIACFDYTRMCPSFINIVSFNHAVIPLCYSDGMIIAQAFDKSKRFGKIQSA